MHEHGPLAGLRRETAEEKHLCGMLLKANHGLLEKSESQGGKEHL